MSSFESGGRQIRLQVRAPDLASTQHAAGHPAALLLHGSGGNVDFWFQRIAARLNERGIALYAVHYFDRTGTTRADLLTLSDGVHVPLWLATVRDTVAHLRSLPEVDPSRVALLGISLGAFLSLALGTERRHGIRAIVDVSGGLVPPYAEHAEPGFPPTLIVHGLEDTVVAPSHALELAGLLSRLRVPHQQMLLEQEGHWFSASAQAQILDRVVEFLQEQLQPLAPSGG